MTQISIRNLAPPPKEKKNKKKDKRRSNKKAEEEKKADEFKIDMGTLALSSQRVPKKHKAKQQELDDSNILQPSQRLLEDNYMSQEEGGVQVAGIHGDSGREQEVEQRVDVLNFADGSLAMEG